MSWVDKGIGPGTGRNEVFKLNSYIVAGLF